MDTLNKLGKVECEMCGEQCECFDVGAVGSPEARCGVCYADGVGHGAQFDTFTDAAEAAEAAFGRDLLPKEAEAIGAYLGGVA